jgi:hypothetical protein
MNKCAIIDADFLFYICLQGNKVLDELGEPIKENGKFVYTEKPFEQACNEIDSFITNLLNVTNADSYIGFFGGSSNYRLQYNNDYKANRKDLVPLNNMKEMKCYLADKWKFNWLAGQSFETDDVCLSFNKENKDSFIISPDKDLKYTTGIRYCPKKNEWIETNEQDEAYFFWQSMIIGDAADGISGLKGKGIKYFERLFNLHIKDKKNIALYPTMILTEYITYYGELNGIKEYYKNYFSLKLRNDLDTSMYYPIEWSQNNIEETNYEIE